MKENNTFMGVLAYLGPLVAIPLFTSKEDPFVKYHVKQGLVLLVIEIILWVLQGFFFWGFWMIYQLIHLGIIILSIIGIVNVVQHKEKELPLVGSFAENFKI